MSQLTLPSSSLDLSLPTSLPSPVPLPFTLDFGGSQIQELPSVTFSASVGYPHEASYKIVLAFARYYLFRRQHFTFLDMSTLALKFDYSMSLKQAFKLKDLSTLRCFWYLHANPSVAFDMLSMAIETKELGILDHLMQLPFFAMSLEVLKFTDITNYRLGLLRVLMESSDQDSSKLVAKLKSHVIYYSISLGSFLPQHQEIIQSVLEGKRVLTEKEHIDLALAI